MGWETIGNLFGGTILSGVNGLAQTFFGSRSARDQQSFELNASNQNEYAAEFQFRENRTAWDSFVDGLNRLPRPLMALGVIALFIWCPIDTVGFSDAMLAMQLIPDPMWIVLGTVVAFFFGDRTLKGVQAFKGPSANQVRQVVEAQRAVRDAALQAPEADGSAARVAPADLRGAAPALPDAEYQADMADTKTPLTNAAILEWNRRQRQAVAP
jgi:hypothetical protein